MHWYVKVENQAYGPYSDAQMYDFVTEGRIAPHSLISNTPENGYFGAAEFDAYIVWANAGQQSVAQPLVAIGGGGASAAVRPAPLYAPIQQVSERAASPIQTRDHISEARDHISEARYQTSPQANTLRQEAENTPVALTTKSCVFLIMAEIRSGGEMAFLQTLQNFGQSPEHSPGHSSGQISGQSSAQAERIGDTVWLVRSAYTVEQIRNALSQTLNQQDRLFILDTSVGKPAWFNIGADLDHRIRELWDENEG